MRPARSRGQTLVLFCLTLLLLVVMVTLTLSIGVRAKRKLELQTLAETAAWSNAVATARTYNTVSLLNRAMVSHWVAMAGVHGLVAWVSDVSSIYGSFAGLAREMETGNPAVLAGPTCRTEPPNAMGKPHWYNCPDYYDPPGPGACTNGTWSIRDASYEWWHAGLALWNPRGSPKSGDNVNSNCKMGNCTTPRPWMGMGWGELDERAARQVREIHESIAGLGLIGAQTQAELQDVLARSRITRQLVRLSQGKKPNGKLPKGFGVEGGLGKKKAQLAWQEAGPKGASSLGDDAHDRVMAEAVLGTRGKEFLIWFREVPRRVRRDLATIQANLDANWPGSWQFAVRPGILATYPGDDGVYFPVVPWEKGVIDHVGFKGMVGHLKGWPEDKNGNGFQLTVRYSPPAGCGGGTKRLRAGTAAYLYSNLADMAHHQWGHGMEMASHARWPMKRLPDDAPNHRDGDTITTCHAFHVHYDERDDADVHKLVNLHGSIRRGDTILPGLGFVFPRSRKKDGAGGAWGQPNLPVLLTWKQPKGKPDPWDLTFRWRMGAGKGTRIDLGDRDKLDDMAALASGMAYYHRRGAWEEAPNFLNPFWRATLVPVGVDSRRNDPTPGRKKESRIPELLRAADRKQAARVFDKVENAFKGLK